MSACVQTPPSTIYSTATSQVQTVIPTTVFSTYAGSPTVDIRTVTTSKCNALNVCEPSTRTDTVLSTPTLTSTIVSDITTDQIITTSFAVSTQTFPPCSSGAPTGVGQFSQTVTMSQSTSSQITSIAGVQFTNTPSESDGTSTQAPADTLTGGRQVGSPLYTVSGTSTIYASGSSISSGSSSAGTASSAADQSSGHKSNSRGAVLTGAIVGAFVLLALASFLFITLRKHCKQRERHAETWGDEYWERRFQELDAEAEQDARSPATLDGDQGQQQIGTSTGHTQKGAEGLLVAATKEKVVDMDDEAWLHMPPKKLRLTLDLQSKDLPTRPPSTLSMISSFFKVRPLASPTSSFHARVVPGAAPAQLKQPRNGQGYNFSRPLRRVSGSTVASKHSHVSRKSAGGRSKLDRLSQLLPLGLPGRTRSSLGLQPQGSPVDPHANEREMTQVGRRRDEGEREAQDGRRGMEWVRTIFDPDAEDLPSAVITASSHAAPGGLPPPPRQRSPPSTIYAESSGRHAHAHAHACDVMEMREIQLSDKGPVSFQPPGPSTIPNNTRQLIPPKPAPTPMSRPTFVPSQTASASSSSSMDSSSSSSSRSKGRGHARQPSKGKRPPDLALSRDALNASLWMEEDVEAVAPSADSAVRQPMPMSQFSPDTEAQRSSFNSTVAPVVSYIQPGPSSERRNRPREEDDDPYAGIEREKSVRAISRNTNATKRDSDSTAAQTFGQFDQESWKTNGRRSGSGEESRSGSGSEDMAGPVTGSTTLVDSVGEKSKVTPTLPSLSWRGERLVSGDWGHLA